MFFHVLLLALLPSAQADDDAAGAEELLQGDISRSVSDNTGVGTAVGVFTNKSADTYRTLVTVTLVSGEGMCDVRLIASGSPTPLKSCLPHDAACAMEIKPGQHANLMARSSEDGKTVSCSAVMKYESK